VADTTILSWITVEVDQALERVRKQLATCAQGSIDAAAVAGCTEHLHQVSGALSMVGLAGATRFCEALESSIPGLSAAANDAVPVLDRAASELKQFVNDVARGDPNVPLRLFPSYRELAQLQGRKDCSEIELFFPDLTPPAPAHPTPKSLEVGELTSFLQSQRTRWQRAILAWIRKQPNALEEMRATLDAIHAVAHQLPERRALWWVAGGLVDTLVDAAEPTRLARARSLCNKLDLYVRDLAAGAQPDNEPLLRELLYAIACARPQTQRQRDIKRLYSLDGLVPPTGPAPTADTAGLQEDLRSKLQALGQAWQRYLAGDASGAANMRERVATLHGGAQALGDGELSRLFAAVAAATARLPSAVEPGSDFLLLEMASALLLAQAMVESLAAPPADTAEQVTLMVGWLERAESGKPAGSPPAGLRPELTQHLGALQLRSRVAGEILANLQQIEQALDAYARGHGGKEVLIKVAPQLRQIDGALRMLGWERAGAVLERCERMIDALTPGSADMDWLAEGLSSLSLYVTPCVQGREPREPAIDVFMQRIQDRAVPRPSAAPAPAAAAPDETLLQIFLDEANEVLATVAASLDACRAAPANLDELAAVRRGFHTLKGSGRMVGLSELGEAAWRVEHAFNDWLDREAPASPELLELASVGHGCFSDWIARLRAGESPAIDPRPINDALARLAGDDSAIKRVRDVYVKEAKQHVATLAAQWTDWRAKSAGAVSVEFTRAAHTLASSSRTARFDGIAQLAAELEQWVPLAERTVEPADRQAIGQAIDALARMLDAVGRDESPAAPIAALAAVQGVRGRLLVPPRPKEKRVMRDDLDDALLPVFLEEAEELAPQVSAGLAAWRANPADRNAPDALKRALHTLKGSARMAGAIRLGELTHLMESRIEYALEAGEVTNELFDDLQTKLDRLSADLEKMATGAAPAAVAAEAAAGGARAPAAPAAAMLRVNAERLDRLINEAGEGAIARSRIEAELRQTKQALAELNESIGRLRTQLREVEIQADSQLQSRHTDLAQHERDFDPLEFDRYTRLQELTRMMAEGLADVASLQQVLVKNVGETDAALLAQARIGRDLQQDLMRMRAVPFANLGERLQRLVRQTGRELNRSAELTIEGGQVELDRGVLERIAAPLEHLLRNSLVHGIEDGPARAAAGKPAAGRIAISLRQEANEVVLVVSDDGAGIDFERLRVRAIERGLLPAEQSLSEAEQVQLVFMSGLSTAASVTELAGRGVGMDVVRTEIQSIGGRIEVTTARGRGTTFTIYLPLTLAVTQTVMVRAGSTVVALSSANVEQVLRIKAEALVSHYEAGHIEFQGRAYPLHYLRQLLGARAPTDIQADNMVLLVRSGAHRVALHVDELVGNREMVVKNIGAQLARMPGVAGATVLPDGAIVLIVNPVQLAEVARGPMLRTATPEVSVKSTRAAPLVMVVDDSLTVRKITGRLLEREGYRVLTAKDGLDALEQMKGELPAILLVDIEMPRMDGFDLARNVRGDPRTMDIPIVMISSRTAPKHRSRAQELGVNAFLGKPYQESELLQQIVALARP